MTPTLEQLMKHFKNTDEATAKKQAEKVLAAIEWLGDKWVGAKNSTFEFKRAAGMFSSGVTK